MASLLGGFRSVARKFVADELSKSTVDIVVDGGAGISVGHFGLIRGRMRHFCSSPKHGNNGADSATKIKLLEYLRTFDYQQGLKKLHDGIFSEKMGRYWSVGGAVCTAYLALWTSQFVLSLLGKESESEMEDQLLKSAQELVEDTEIIENAVALLESWVGISNGEMSLETKIFMRTGAAKLAGYIHSYPKKNDLWKREMMFKLDPFL